MREKDPAKAELIREAALKLVLRKGLTALKMGDLATEANLAAGTIYLYFDNKEDLIHKLYDQLKIQLISAYLEGYNPERPFIECLRTLWNNYLDTAARIPESIAFIEQYHRSPYLRSSIQEESLDILKPIYDLIDTGKAKQWVVEAPTPLIVSHLVGALNEMVRWQINGNLELNGFERRQAFDMAWNGIRR